MNHRKLPRSAQLIGVIDFTRSRRDMKAVALLGLVSIAAMVPLGLLRQGPAAALEALRAHVWLPAACIGMCILYIPLHELVHGALMFALSGVKPVYGIRLPYAYAGSSACFDRRSHAVIALAPLVLLGTVLALLELFLPAWWFWSLYIVQISNVSGSMGDVYTVWRLASRPGDVLIRDTGTRMCLYRINTEIGEKK